MSLRSVWWAVACVPALLIWWQAAHPLGTIGYDFTSYAAAARAVALGHDPYHRLLAEYPQLRGGGSGVVGGNGYVYPPLLAVLLAVPLQLGLRESALWLLWCVIGLAGVLWLANALSRALFPTRVWTAMPVFAALALLPAIVRYDLSLGQSDLALAALAIGAQSLRLRGHVWTACAVVGIAIAVKPMLALLLLVWLWTGDRRAFALGAGFATVLLLGPFLVIGGLTPLREYVAFFGAWGGLHGDANFVNQSAYGLLLRTLTVNPYVRPLAEAAWLVLPLRGAVALGGGLLWVMASPRGRTADTAQALGTYLLALPLLLLVSPLSEDIHFCLLIPALLGLGSIAWLRDGWRPATVALGGVLVLCCLPRMQELIFPDRLVMLPGQTDPRLGPFIVLLRTNLLFLAAAITLVAGYCVLRRPVPSADRRHVSIAVGRIAEPLTAGRVTGWRGSGKRTDRTSDILPRVLRTVRAHAARQIVEPAMLAMHRYT